MATGKDATYAGQSNYQEQGGGRTVIGGELDVVSGGRIDIEDGGSITQPVQTLGSSQVATNVTNFGLTTITATTTGPTYTVAAPVAGVTKIIACTANTSSGTAVINSNSTGVSFTTSGDNEITMNSIKDRVILVAASTTSWIISSMMGSTDAGITTGTQST